MFLKNIVFYLVFLQVVFSSENNNSQFNVVSTIQEPSKLDKINLTIDSDNLVDDKLESILQNHFEYQNKIITKMINQIEMLNKNITILINTKLKNEPENNNQTLRPKHICMGNSHQDLQKLIEGVLQNQSTQHNKFLSEIKSQFETTKGENLTLKKHNNQFDEYNIENGTEQLLISHIKDTKAFMENVNNKLAKLTLPKTCKEVQERVNTVSGVYTIWPDFSPRSFDVWCDMETRGGGWIYVINRFDGSVNFNLSWNYYKNGFGNLNGEFWLGLEHLYILTKSEPNELLIELVDQNLIKTYAHYEEFSIGNEGEGYPIKTIKDYSGDAGDDFSLHLGWKFTTTDRDQDTYPGNCAVKWGGGFWYTDCYYYLFTGIYDKTGIIFQSFREDERLKKVKMMIRS